MVIQQIIEGQVVMVAVVLVDGLELGELVDILVVGTEILVRIHVGVAVDLSLTLLLYQQLSQVKI